MENYQELLTKYQKELDDLSREKAVLQSQIEAMCKDLSLDPNDDLDSHIGSLIETITKSLEEADKSIKAQLDTLESLKLDGIDSAE